MNIRNLIAIGAVLTVAGAASAGVASATAYGLSTSGTSLYSWDVSSPGFTNFVGSVSGMQDGEVLEGIDFRPATGELYGLGSTSRMYKINTSTGAATQVGSGQFSTLLSGRSFGFDFNPTVDRIRVTSDLGQNIRLHPVTGGVAATDSNLNGVVSASVASAYTNSFAGSTSTTLYNLDAGTNSLYTQIPPNNGTTNLVGALGVDFSDAAGFDIHGPNAYAVLNTGGSYSGFYRIDLATGAATLLGEVGDFQRGTIFFKGLAIIPAPGIAGLIGAGTLAAARRRR